MERRSVVDGGALEGQAVVYCDSCFEHLGNFGYYLYILDQ